ncbi:MAG TPA: ubiquinol-cytochrome c reductase iron-sulfur subunit [Candidatus Deferrimicrobiaceae bacterium]|jgi:Rieske Fe-S protein
METVDRSRRRLIGSVAAAASLLFLGKWLSPAKRAADGRKLLTVPKADIPEGGALVYRESRVVVVKERGVVYAMSLVCTHLGCTVSVGPDGIACPCHGSQFDRAGNVLKGPATQALARLPVEDRGDTLVVMTSSRRSEDVS